MELPNRPLTEDEARKMIADWRKGWPAIPSFYDELQEILKQPRTHVVHYWRDGRVKYMSPDTFWFGPQGDSVLHIRELK